MLNDRKYFDDDNKKKNSNWIELYRTRAIGFKGIFIKLGQASFWTPIKQVSCKDPFMFKLVNCIRKIVWDKENENKKHMRVYVVIVIYCIVLCSVLWFCLACCLFAYFSWPIYLVKSLPREKHREFSRTF